MTRTRKEQLVAEMTAEFKSAGAIIVCDYKGMTVEKLEIVRNLAKDEETKVKVIQINTLLEVGRRKYDKN